MSYYNYTCLQCFFQDLAKLNNDTLMKEASPGIEIYHTSVICVFV